MEKDIEKAYERFLELSAITDAIHNRYSSNDVKEKINEEYTYLLFDNYLMNKWGFQQGSNRWFILPSVKGYDRKDLFTFFYSIFHNYIDFFKLNIWDWDAKHFFDEWIYLTLNDDDLNKVTITLDDSVTKKAFWDLCYSVVLGSMLESTYYLYYESKGYKNEKKQIINTFSYLYSIYGDEFEINERMFNKKGRVSFLEMVISYYYLGFIEITSCGLWWDGEILQVYWLRILPRLREVLDEVEHQREILLDRVFDEKYTEIKIKKKKWGSLFVESQTEYSSEEIKFVELQKKYPHSDISAKNYNGKVQKYIVKEKKKLNSKSDDI